MSNRVIKILMNRDGITRDEAVSRINECQEMIEEAMVEGDFEGVDDIIASELGLEPDYVMDLMY